MAGQEQTADGTTGDPSFKLPAELNFLHRKHELIFSSIVSSTKMKSKIGAILTHLQGPGKDIPARSPAVVCLHAKGPVSSKLVSVAEIGKQELSRQGVKWWQYSTLIATVQQHEKKVSGTREGHVDKGEAEDEAEPRMVKSAPENATAEEEAFFETMSTSRTSKADGEPKKVRKTPVLVIFLSNCQIPELKARFGEQSSK